MLNIDFQETKPQLICHPDYQNLAPSIVKALEPYNIENHFILFSSGTTGGSLKGYAISKTALFANAKAVNTFFNLSSKDVWALSLPIYHIGGLSVLARAELLGSELIDARNLKGQDWVEKIQDATITTIVPTQLHDLVKAKIRPPKKLKYLVVGGDYLSQALRDEATKLGWPVIRTFGMSEVSSQLASSISSVTDELTVLPIHEVKIGDGNRLMVKTPSLFTLQFVMEENDIQVIMAGQQLDPDGFYLTSDRAEVTHTTLKHLGRVGDDYKVAGHLINLTQLKETLSSYLMEKGLYGQMELVLEDDERKGKKLVLLTLKDASIQLEDIASVLSPVKIDEIRFVTAFARTALGKIKKQ